MCRPPAWNSLAPVVGTPIFAGAEYVTQVRGSTGNASPPAGAPGAAPARLERAVSAVGIQRPRSAGAIGLDLDRSYGLDHTGMHWLTTVQ